MKILLVVSAVLVASVVGWESEPPKKYHGPLHHPVIHKGVPVDTPEVQHARSAHLEAFNSADHGHHEEHHHHEDYHHEEPKYHGPLHYPVIKKGVPIDTPEVQHARAAHLNALEHADHGPEESHHEYAHHQEEKKYHGPLHYPVITKKGVPVEPSAVQHAREEHLSAVAYASHGHGY